MAGKNSDEILRAIIAHIKKQGGAFGDWYAGVTGSIENRLFGDHNVPRQDYWRIYDEAFNAADARYVEDRLLEMGCKGGSGGGDASAKFIYAYLISGVTRE